MLKECPAPPPHVKISMFCFHLFELWCDIRYERVRTRGEGGSELMYCFLLCAVYTVVSIVCVYVFNLLVRHLLTLNAGHGKIEDIEQHFGKEQDDGMFRSIL